MWLASQTILQCRKTKARFYLLRKWKNPDSNREGLCPLPWHSWQLWTLPEASSGCMWCGPVCHGCFSDLRLCPCSLLASSCGSLHPEEQKPLDPPMGHCCPVGKVGDDPVYPCAGTRSPTAAQAQSRCSSRWRQGYGHSSSRCVRSLPHHMSVATNQQPPLCYYCHLSCFHGSLTVQWTRVCLGFFLWLLGNLKIVFFPQVSTDSVQWEDAGKRFVCF